MPSPLHAAAARCYQALLRVYPGEFREEYGRELRLVFRDRLQEHPTPAGVILNLLHACAGVLLEAPKEHCHMIFQDLKYAVRILRKEPLVTGAAAAILALGIGSTTLVYSIANGLLVRPLPYPEAERLVAVQEFRHDEPRFTQVPFRNFEDMRVRTRLLDDIAAYTENNRALRQGSEAEQVPVGAATAGLFRVLDVKPIHGRTFTSEEDVPNGPAVVVLGYDLWQRRYGSDPNVLGRSIQLGSRTMHVIGVMPAGFHFPQRAEAWVPLQANPANEPRTNYWLNAVARLKPGVSVQQASGEVRAMLDQIHTENPIANGGQIGRVVPFRDAVAGEYREAVVSLLVAVVFLLLIACANVSNLLLAKASVRKREMAVRTALGASRRRLIRQLVSESLMLGAVGGAAGLALAYVGVPALLSLIPIELPRWMDFSVDVRVLLFAVIISFLTSLVFGTAPALFVSRDVTEGLKEAGRGRTASVRQHLLRNGLVVAEVALSLTLLIGAGLMVRSFLAVRGQDLGYRPENVVTMQVAAPNKRELLRRLTTELESAPGVTSVVFASGIPLASMWGRSLTVEGYPVLPLKDAPSIFNVQTTPGYFRTLGIPLLQGRDFVEQDYDTQTVIVSESLARKYWTEGSAIGKRVRFGPPEDNEPWHTIIGVVADATNEAIKGGGRPNVYVPWNSSNQVPFLIARGSGDPLSLARTLKTRISAVDASFVVSRILSMDQVVTRATWRDRFFAVLFAVFAGLALMLASGGLYAVLAYSVSMRTHEIGIRMALGASATQVRLMVMRQGIVLAALGLLVGIMGATATSRLLKSQLYQVSPMDLQTYVAVVVMVVIVAVTASFLPSHRATRVHPMVALRQEP
jgi:putative ABC transport system permease protein